MVFGLPLWLSSKITADGDHSHEMKTLISWKKSYDQPRQHIKKQRHYFADKGPSSQSFGFSSSHVSVTRVYVPQFFVSSQQRLGATNIKALGASQLLGLGQTVL